MTKITQDIFASYILCSDWFPALFVTAAVDREFLGGIELFGRDDKVFDLIGYSNGFEN